MPDWFTQTLIALPPVLWMIVGVGLPWALVALPRRDWRDRPLVACLMLAFGPALTTAWMFVLGTIGQNSDPQAGDTINPMQTTIRDHVGGEALLRPDLILLGTVLLALVGIGLAWIKARRTDPVPVERVPLAVDERLLIAFIVVATAARWLITAWLPFGSWDPLWVYGYQGRIYTLIGYIPADIGYYPQFLPLQYAYAQIMSLGAISDAAARSVLPFLQIGSILAVYVLGARLVNRRTGIFAAALWALYPHFGYWTRVGDLEIPLTFGFTGAAAFFLLAWTLTGLENRGLRRRYALIAGLFFGIAMWTKPTAGAFVWGVLLLVVFELLRQEFNWRAWWPRFEVAAITGLASIPLGAVWYVRNLLLGHDAVVFPDSVWLTRAMRSGAEFGWPLLALFTLLAYLHFGPVRFRPDRRGTLVGLGLVLLGVLPSILEPSRMDWPEWLALTAGLIVLAFTLNDYDYGLSYAAEIRQPAMRLVWIVNWAWLLALPYFVTWFFSYSYHYRLSFAIVPLMLLPTAIILARWVDQLRPSAWRLPRRLAYAATLFAISLPGIGIAVYDAGLGWDWLWTIPPEDDYSKAALLGVVDYFETYHAAYDEPPVILAPGLQTLPFFFPRTDIRIMETPRRTAELDGVTHFIVSRETEMAYSGPEHAQPFQNQWITSLHRPNVADLAASFQDPSFFYEIYRLHPERRFTLPEDATPLEEEVIFGDFARLVDVEFNTDILGASGVQFETVWQALDAPPADYSLYVHLVPADDLDGFITGWDGPVAFGRRGFYSTRFWEEGEYILDSRTLFTADRDIPPGQTYRIRIGFYDDSGRVPVTVDGEPVGDGYLLETVLTAP